MKSVAIVQTDGRIATDGSLCIGAIKKLHHNLDFEIQFQDL